MQIALAATPDPTYGMPADSRNPWMQPSPPPGPCSAGNATSGRKAMRAAGMPASAGSNFSYDTFIVCSTSATAFALLNEISLSADLPPARRAIFNKFARGVRAPGRPVGRAAFDVRRRRIRSDNFHLQFKNDSKFLLDFRPDQRHEFLKILEGGPAVVQEKIPVQVGHDQPADPPAFQSGLVDPLPRGRAFGVLENAPDAAPGRLGHAAVFHPRVDLRHDGFAGIGLEIELGREDDRPQVLEAARAVAELKFRPADRPDFFLRRVQERHRRDRAADLVIPGAAVLVDRAAERARNPGQFLKAGKTEFHAPGDKCGQVDRRAGAEARPGRLRPGLDFFEVLSQPDQEAVESVVGEDDVGAAAEHFDDDPKRFGRAPYFFERLFRFGRQGAGGESADAERDRKSTRLNSSHS